MCTSCPSSSPTEPRLLMEVYKMQSINPHQQYYADTFRDTAEKAGSIRSGHVHPHHNVNDHGYGYGYPPPPLTPGKPAPNHSQEPLPGSGPDGGSKGINIKRGFAIGGLVAIFILFAAVIGLAAGLGMSQDNLRQARNDLAIAQSRLGGSAADSTNPTPTTAAPPPTSPTPTAQAAIECPAGNGTLYTATTGHQNKQFQIICGIDYGQKEATDISNKKVASLDQCMDLCAAKTGCTGAGWGKIGGDQGDLHSCWMKKGLKSPHEAPNWGFGVFIKVLDN